MQRILFIEIAAHALDQNTLYGYLLFHRRGYRYAYWKVQRDNFHNFALRLTKTISQYS